MPPLVDGTLDVLTDTNFDSRLDLASGFWQVCVREEDIHKTTFQTPYAWPHGLPCRSVYALLKQLSNQW
jgi:hypothetical protein